MKDLNNPTEGMSDSLPSSAPVGIESVNPAPNPQSQVDPDLALSQGAKTEGWKSALTIFFLIFSPLIGVILTWALTNWSKATKIIITVVFGLLTIVVIIGILAATVLVGMGGAREKAKDTMAMSELRLISSGLEIYYDETSKTNPDGTFTGSYPVGNSFKTMYNELLKSHSFAPLNYRNNSGSQDPNTGLTRKYCSTDGTAYRLTTTLHASNKLHEITSPNKIDTCTPGE